MPRSTQRPPVAIIVAALLLVACTGTPTPAPIPSPAPVPTRASVSTPTVAPTATPRPPGNPILLDRSPSRGEEVAPDQPLILTFDQGMDRDSVRNAIELCQDGASCVQSSAVFEWTRDNVLSVRPAGGWPIAAQFTLSLKPTAKSATGKVLARAESFSISTIGTLAVAQVLPADGAGEIGADASVTILFNRPVVALTSLDKQSSLPAPLKLEPDVAGTGEWLNTSIFVFRPGQPLAAGLRYTGTVAAGLKDTTGATLAKDFTFGFTVSAPAIKRVFGLGNESSVDLRAPISVTFSQKMDHDATRAAFKLTPDVRGRFAWADEPAVADSARGGADPVQQPQTGGGEILAFFPEDPYIRATNYSLVISADARARVGGAALQSPLLLKFRSMGRLGVAQTQPANASTGVSASSGFSIRFTAPVAPETVLDNVTFSPAISLTRAFTYYSQSDYRYTLNVPLQPSTKYVVTIGKNVRDKYGEPMAQDVVAGFTTSALSSILALNTNGLAGTYSASRPTQLFATYRNIAKMDFELASLSPQEAADALTGDRSSEFLDKLTADRARVLRRWSIAAQAGLNEIGFARVSLDEAGGALKPGLYLLSAASPELAASTGGYRPQRHILVVTDLHVTLKNGERDALAWVTDLNSAKPVAGAKVVFRDRRFGALGQAATDKDGMVLVTGFDPNRQIVNGMYATVGEPGSAGFGFVLSYWNDGLQPYDFNLPQQYDFNPFSVYMQTDRPIYRPGQVVYFKGILRADQDARYTVAPSVSKLDFFIFNDQGQRVFSGTLALGASGTFSTQFTLDTAAPSGSYYTEVCAPNPYFDPKVAAASGTLASQRCSTYRPVNFSVATYRRPEFETTLATDRDDYLDGDRISATVQSKYFFGGNVAGARVEWTLFQRDFFYSRYSGSGSYAFGDFDYFFLRETGFNSLVASGSGVTDSSGQFSLQLPTDLAKRKNSAEYTLEASVTDANDQSVSARRTVVVHKSDVYVGVAPESYVARVGEAVTLNAVMVDLLGKPVANRDAELGIFLREWYSVQEEDRFGNRTYTSVPSDTLVSTVTVRGGADGKATTSFTPKQGGTFRIVASSGGSRANISAATMWVSSRGEYVGWRVDNNDRIELRTDKAAYAVGDVIKLLIPSPFSGTATALVTLERGSFLQRQVVQLQGNSTVIEIPAVQAFAPNAYVSVVLAKGVDESNPLPAYRLGNIGFKVDVQQFALNVKIEPEKTAYAPGDTAVYNVTVTDAAGKPVQAELAVAVVDKAVLSLQDSNSAPLLDYFYGARPLGVRTADSLNVSVDRLTQKIIAEYGKGGGGGRALSDLASDAVRGNFKDTAYWEAVVTTDAAGKAQIKVTLPDNLTTWRMDARAIADGTPGLLVGQSTADILASKPLLVRPVTPRFFVVGDEVTLGAVVNNNTPNDLDVDVALDARGVRVVSTATTRVRIPAGSSGRVNWSVVVEDAAQAGLTFSASGGGLRDASTPTLATGPAGGIPIYRYVLPETVATAGDVSEAGSKLEVVALPARLDTGRGALTVQIDTSLAQVIRNGLDDLALRAYEDNELTASRLVVGVALKQPAQDVSRHVQRLQGAQRGDGGWGWWDSSQQSSPAVSAQVIMALARAQVAGYPVDSGVMARARDYLSRQLVTVTAVTDARVANQQVVLLHALSEAGAANAGRMSALYDQRAKLAYYARALLALGLNRVNKGDTRIATLMSDLSSAAVLGPAGASWQEKRPESYAFNSNARSTAIVLNALARLDPASQVASNVVRWLMVARQGRAWETSQETAWAVLGLSEWRNAVGEAGASYDWRVTLNDAAILSGNASSGSATVSVPVSKLSPQQGNDVAFEHGAGNGRLYYTLRLASYLPADQAKALSRGIAVARKYEQADCTPEPGKPCAAISSARIGQNVRVRLTIVAPADLYFVRVVDPLPGGVEAIDTSLKTTEQAGAAVAASPYEWGWWWFDHSQLRDESAVIEATFLPAGTYEYTYLVRPSIAGTFQVMPTNALQSYFPESFGRSDGAKFVVQP